MLGAFYRDAEGATEIEYGLILFLILLAILIGLEGVGDGVSALFDKASSDVNSAVNYAVGTVPP